MIELSAVIIFAMLGVIVVLAIWWPTGARKKDKHTLHRSRSTAKQEVWNSAATRRRHSS